MKRDVKSMIKLVEGLTLDVRFAGPGQEAVSGEVRIGQLRQVMSLVNSFYKTRFNMSSAVFMVQFIVKNRERVLQAVKAAGKNRELELTKIPTL